MKRAVSVVVSLAAVHVASVWLWAEATGKSPLPSDAAQQQALDTVKEIYGEEYKRATTPDQRAALALKLLEKASECRNDPASHFVLLRLARDVAIQGGDANTVFRVIEEIVAAYEVDAYRMRVDSLLQTAREATASSQQAAVVAHALSLVNEAWEADDYGTARALAEAALGAARRDSDKSAIRSVVARKQQIDEAAKVYEQVEPATARLEQSPTDPEANLAVGRYLCLVKGGWDKGLSMLALGSDATLKNLAVKDLENPTRAEVQADVGDAWWELAEKEEGLARQELIARATHWYQKALPGLTGLVKTKVQKRLDSLTESTVPARATSAGRNTRLVVLFDGRTLNGWRPREPNKASSWTIERGQLIGLPRANGSDLVSEETFQNFELHLEFLLGRGTNSGVYFRGQYEIQLYDDKTRPIIPERSCGALWGQLAPKKRAFLGPGTWNTLDVRLVDREITVTLNGQTVIDRETLRGPTSKDGIGVEGQPGPILLQHLTGQGEVRFRNIRVRRLD